MKYPNRPWQKTVPVVLILAVSAGLSACGGGGGSSPPPGETVDRNRIVIRAPDILITPPEAVPVNRTPEAVGFIPPKTLTAGRNADAMSVARYFRDPDGDPLTYSARSDRPGIVSVGMSGETLTLDPLSSGDATVMVTASDGDAEASQTFATTVRRRRSVSNKVDGPSSPPPSSSPPVQSPPPEPETRLTGIRLVKSGATFATLNAVPSDAQLGGVSFDWDPGNAGRIRSLAIYDNQHFYSFTCDLGQYTGSVELKARVDNPDGGKFRDSVTLTCQ